MPISKEHDQAVDVSNLTDEEITAFRDKQCREAIAVVLKEPGKFDSIVIMVDMGEHSAVVSAGNAFDISKLVAASLPRLRDKLKKADPTFGKAVSTAELISKLLNAKQAPKGNPLDNN